MISQDIHISLTPKGRVAIDVMPEQSGNQSMLITVVDGDRTFTTYLTMTPYQIPTINKGRM